MKSPIELAVCTAVLAGVTLGVFGFSFAAAASPGEVQPSKPIACFYVNQFENWRAPNTKTIYIRVNFNRYYRLDLAGTYPMLLWPDVHLIMDVRGPGTICSAVDWDLRISENWNGILTGAIVKKMTVLSPAEVAAIPKKFKP